MPMRSAVRFSEGVERLLQAESTVFLEIGPGQTLATFVRQHPAKDSARAILNSVRHPNQTQPDMAVLLTALAQLWLAGVSIDWRALHGEPHPRGSQNILSMIGTVRVFLHVRTSKKDSNLGRRWNARARRGGLERLPL